MIILISVVSMVVALCHAQTCDDVDSAICQDMYSINPYMCSNTCYSMTLCPRFCGKCPLKCYSCHEVDNPDLCSTTTQCLSPDHYCIVTQSFNEDFKDVYILGCALNSVCTAQFGPALGRTDESLSERSQLQRSCCSTDLCNVKIRNITTTSPKVTPQPNLTSTSAPALSSGLCDDIGADICTRLETHFPDMCNIDCIANEVCPRKCGKCMGCYQCSHVTRPESCTHKTICAREEQCFSVETISASFEQGFRLGCMDQRLCSTFGHAAPGIFGKRQGFELSLQCCNEELCNHHALLPTSTVPPTTPVPTTRVPTTSVPTTPVPTTPVLTTVATAAPTGCPDHFSTCPHGWFHHHSSCFTIGTPPMNWNSAKAYCEKKCGELADFDSSTDLHSVATDLGHHFYPHTGGGPVWVAGQLSHGVWRWPNTEHVADSLQGHIHNHHNSYCGHIIMDHHSSDSSHNMHEQDCSHAYQPLCEIKHVSH